MEEKKRILTGDRSTGRLHLGHYAGSLENRVKLQHVYDTLIIIADVQALTTNFDHPEKLKQDVMEVALDNLAAGIIPDQASLFIQSMIPQIAELTLFFSMFTSVNLLRHNPTIKAEAKERGYKELNYGFLGYPVSQAADIAFCKADFVPVGDDNVPHVELTRKIVRHFNQLYKPIFKEPEAIISECSRLIGLDGNKKMSKSLNNAIFLSDEENEIASKIRKAVTDRNRITLQDKGNPEACVVYQYHKTFNKEESGNISHMCSQAQIGCVACKQNLVSGLNQVMAPIRERRRFYGERIKEVQDFLYSGTEKVRRIAEATMEEVREAMEIRYF